MWSTKLEDTRDEALNIDSLKDLEQEIQGVADSIKKNCQLTSSTLEATENAVDNIATTQSLNDTTDTIKSLFGRTN
jgi:hypothetical protein